MRLTLFLIGMVIFGIIVTGLWGASGSMAQSYGISTSENLEELSKVGEIREQAEEMQPIFNNPFEQVPILREVYSIGFAGMQAIITVLDTIDILLSTIFTIGGLLPIPGFILDGLKALAIIAFLGGILTVIFGGGKA